MPYQHNDMWYDEINIGCGDHPLEGALNVDVRDLPLVDMVVDIVKLPFQDRSFENVHCSDVVEHLGHRDYFTAIDECCRVCQDRLYLKTLALDKLLEQYQVGAIDEDALVLLLYGGQDYPENTHQSIYPAPRILARLRTNGFVVDAAEYDAIGNIQITAHRARADAPHVKPGATTAAEAEIAHASI